MTRIFLALAMAAFATAVATAAPRPNIVFIFSDDHAPNAISAYPGGILDQAAPTPSLDRLADEGMLFARSYCSNSICGPSRAAILTGKHSHVNGYIDNNSSTFDGSQTTFPKLMQKEGYQTAIVGKWHLVSKPQGFDYWEILPGQGSYYNPEFLRQEGGRKQYTGYCTDIITDRAIRWLEEGRDKDKPFILMCQHKAPHRNWSPAPRHLTLFDDMEMPEPSNLFDDYANRSKTLKEQKMSIEHDMLWANDMKFTGDNKFPDHFAGDDWSSEYPRMTDEQRAKWDAAYGPKNEAFLAKLKAGELTDKEVVRWKYQRYVKDYLRCIRAVDENVGRLMDYIDDQGLADNTIVIYSSDQGFYLGEHNWYDKRWMFEESFMMPLIVRWPGTVKPGVVSPALVQNIDYAPTFLEIAGAEAPATVQGRSLLPLLKAGDGEVDDWREGLYYYYSGEATHRVAAHDGVATSRYKLMWFPGGKEWNLFDLKEDPREMRSVHDDPGYASVLKRMKELYTELRAKYQRYDATTPAHRKDRKWWKERLAAKKKEAGQGGHKLVFIGDSITQGWEGKGKEVWAERFARHGALNLGYSGDRTEHALWRLLNGELPDAVDPEAFVVMIGTNNTGHNLTPAVETAAGIELIVELLQDRRPHAEIVLCSVFPRGATPGDAKRVRNREVNALIKPLADHAKVHWVDFDPVFLEEDGALSEKIMPDLLHLSPEGYARWADALKPVLQELGL